MKAFIRKHRFLVVALMALTALLPSALFAYNLKTAETRGWDKPNTSTWTYASASTFTVNGDRIPYFTVGQKLRLVQSDTLAYFFVTADPTYDTNTKKTTVTVSGMGYYTLANAAISSPFYSEDANPQGWPVTMGQYVGKGQLRGALVTATPIAPQTGEWTAYGMVVAGTPVWCWQFSVGARTCTAGQ